MSDKYQGGILAGSIDVSLPAFLQKAADSTEQTGKVAVDMNISYWRQGGVRVAVSASDLAAVNSAHSDGGVKEIDATNMAGSYRVDWPDAAFATGADWVVLTVKVAATFVWTQVHALTTNVIQTGDSFVRIGATGTGLSSLATSAALTTVAGFLDTEVTAILGLLDDPRSEPGQGAPPVNPDLATKIDYLYKAWRNKKTQTATTHNLFGDDATTVHQKSTVSDDGTTATRGEIASGP